MKPKSPPPQRDAMPAAFATWWEPAGRDKESGASVGGHPDARRIWARKDKDGWSLKISGVDAKHAWADAAYRAEFNARSDDAEPFVSIAATLEQQSQFGRIVRDAVHSMKRTVRPKQSDYDAGKAPRVEPLDEQKAREQEEKSDEPIEF